MSTHNIGFYEDLTKIIFELSSNIIKYAPYFFCWSYELFSCLILETFPWCGMFLNTKTLEVGVEYGRYSGNSKCYLDPSNSIFSSPEPKAHR